jgi:hypothetical protein
VTYEEIRDAIAHAPATWIPGLLRICVTMATVAKVFRPGGLVVFVKKAESMVERQPKDRLAATPTPAGEKK